MKSSFLPLGLIPIFLFSAFGLAVNCHAALATPASPLSEQPDNPSRAALFYGVTPLSPPYLQKDPAPQYWSQARKWQGIPGIERAPGGRLWATWYAGPLQEGADGNYAVLVTSDDDGKTWSEPVAVFHPFGFFECKTFDPLLWTDPDGNLWWIHHRWM